tara:strand:- start:160 stop:456 length:297 start_codon:yes stop_codon:yes gene_type:complete
MVDRIKIQNAYYDSATEILWADTPDGDVYIWIGIGCARPNVALADAVCDKGSINPDKWVFHRAIYGSPAYEARGVEAFTAYQERYEGFGEGDELAHVW